MTPAAPSNRLNQKTKRGWGRGRGEGRKERIAIVSAKLVGFCSSATPTNTPYLGIRRDRDFMICAF